MSTVEGTRSEHNRQHNRHLMEASKEKSVIEARGEATGVEKKEEGGLIERIRREKLVDTDLNTAHPEIAPALRQLQGTLSRSLRVLALDIFASGSHFVSELIQNADDNTYAKGSTEP